MSTKIRIATLNVNWWLKPTSLKDYIGLIKDLHIDLLALQESQTDTIEKLVAELNDIEPQNSNYKWSHCSKQLLNICNSIITRYPIIEQNTCVWNKMKNNGKHRKEERCAVMIKILINSDKNKTLSVMCTHLDHINEETRLAQMKYFLDNTLINDNNNNEEKKANDIEQKSQYKYPDILCGDFNSILQSDYTQKEWESISNIRKDNSWELPMSNVMNELLINNGYTDSLRYVLKKQFYELNYLNKVNNSNDEKTSNENKIMLKFEDFDSQIDLIKWIQYEKYKDELDCDMNKMFFDYYKKNGWQYTSRYYTRIDYVLLSKDLTSYASDVGFKDTMSCVMDDQSKVYKSGLTDHNLYWCDIRIKE